MFPPMIEERDPVPPSFSPGAAIEGGRGQKRADSSQSTLTQSISDFRKR